MANPLVDGLGGEEVETGSMAGLSAQNLWLNGNFQSVGSVTTASHVIAGQSVGVTGSVIVTGKITGADINVTGSVVAASVETTGSLVAATKVIGQSITATGSIVGPRNIVVGSSVELPITANNGIVITTLPAVANISGGMWVTGSAVSGTTPTYLAKPLPTGAGRGALGICLAYTASGTASYPTILTRGLYKGIIAEGTVSAGDMIAPGVGAALNTCVVAAGGSARGYCLMGAGSEGTCSVWLW